MSRILSAMVMLLAGLPALADQQSYPFKLAIRSEHGKQILSAQNDGSAPILATVNLINPDGAIIDHTSPIMLVVKPQERIQIASIHGAVAGQRYRITTPYKFSIGDPDAIHDPAATYQLPFQDGQAVKVGQVFGGRITTHNDLDSRYAVDFDVPIGTPVLAARSGRVVDIDQNFTQGGNDPSLKANHVLILHEDGTLGIYSHFSANRISVSIGQWVNAGTLIGYSGNTGYSSGPHVHFAVLINSRTPDGSAKYVSVPVNFVNGAPDQQVQLLQDEILVVNHGGQLPPQNNQANSGSTIGMPPVGSMTNSFKKNYQSTLQIQRCLQQLQLRGQTDRLEIVILDDGTPCVLPDVGIAIAACCQYFDDMFRNLSRIEKIHQ